MPITLNEQLSMLEIAKRIDPNGNMATIAEVMTENNAILEDAPMLECNNMTQHQITQRTYIPTGERRKYNKGVGSGATQTKTIVEGTTMRELYSPVDKALNELQPNPAAARSNEDMAIVEGLSQGMANDLFYAVRDDDPSSFNGLAIRLASKSYANVLSHAGSNNRTSLYIVQYGPTKAHLIYPRGSKSAGVQHVSLGEMPWNDPDDPTKKYQALVSHFKAHYGWSIHDMRCVARLGDIDVTNLDGFDEDYLIALLNKMPQRGKGAVIYCNSDMFTLFDIRAKDKSNVSYGPANVWGQAQVMFRGNIPIKLVDQISSSESALAA